MFAFYGAQQGTETSPLCFEIGHNEGAWQSWVGIFEGYYAWKGLFGSLGLCCHEPSRLVAYSILFNRRKLEELDDGPAKKCVNSC